MKPILFRIFLKNKHTFTKDNLLLNFLVLKQKRYVPKQIFCKDVITSSKKIYFLINFQKFFFYQNTHLIVQNNLLKFFRNYTNFFNLTLNKRLLRTRKLLVLPAHFNISIITNSFDVVHS